MQEAIIFSLLEKPTYLRTVLDKLKNEYFDNEHQIVFKTLKAYINHYDNVPTKKELVLSIKNNPHLSEDVKGKTLTVFKDIFTQQDEYQNPKFLLDKTLEFIQYKEFTINVLKGAELITNKGDFTPIVDALTEALKISFDEEIGTDVADIEAIASYLVSTIESDLTTGIFNIDKVMHLLPKTLSIVSSVSHGGKSVFLATTASHLILEKKKNVVFLTLEMSENETLKRIYANILNHDINTFKTTPKEVISQKFDEIKDHLGRLIVKEYPPNMLTANMIEAYLERLQTQTGIKPDLLIVDYLGIMASNVLSPSVGPYAYFKRIAEELRALAIKLNIPILSAAQINRSGYGNTSAGLEAVSDSIGIAQTADIFFILSRTKEMDDLNQANIMFKKNRSTGFLGDCLIGTDFSRMRFFGMEEQSISYTVANPSTNTHGHGHVDNGSPTMATQVPTDYDRIFNF